LISQAASQRPSELLREVSRGSVTGTKRLSLDV